jgi:HAD superfamily hydrolase (TIGR01509 family)
MMNGIEAVLFDMDGVLVNSEPVILAAAMACLAEYGLQPKPEDFVPFIGAGEDRFIGGVAEKYGLTYRKEMKKRVYQIYQEIAPEKLETYQGVVELLNRLKQNGIHCVLASSADRIKIQTNLKVAHIHEDLFSIIVSGEDVELKKPAPDIYLIAAQKINIPPASCIVVEDALNGIQAAKSAGMQCIAVCSSFNRQTLLKVKPDFICDQIADVGEVIKLLINQ